MMKSLALEVCVERVTYSEDLKNAFFDGYKFRRDAKTGYYLAAKPTDGKRRERLHCYVWRYFNGPVPDGFHIHHIDEDKRNNDIENLTCISQFNHLSLHGKERAENNYKEIVMNLAENAVPKSKEWHRSKAGRKWHSEQAIKNAQNMEERKFTCQYCGEIFYKKPLGHIKFCSNNCKSANRRRLGIDDEMRKCIICGREFKANKYSAKQCCSAECTCTLRRNNRRSGAGERTGL